MGGRFRCKKSFPVCIVPDCAICILLMLPNVGLKMSSGQGCSASGSVDMAIVAPPSLSALPEKFVNPKTSLEAVMFPKKNILYYWFVIRDMWHGGGLSKNQRKSNIW